MIYLCNGLSDSMYHDPRMKQISEPLSEAEFIDLIHNTNWKSAIGHESLARCLSKLTGKKIFYNRRNLNITYDDVILKVSLKGRLPENPSYVEYRGRLIFSFVRFEKQTQIDLENTRNKIQEIKMEVI